MTDETVLQKNLAEIYERIKKAASKVRRNPDEIKLIAVSKTHPGAVINEAIKAGAIDFGENKVQEAEGKINEIGREKVCWHLIGNLQSNKARKAVRLFDIIHTLDSVELALRLERICQEEERPELPVLIQLDLAGEATKSGISEKDLPDLIETLQTCEHLNWRGLMILPPYFEDAELVRPYFRRLREIRDRVLLNGELSMGMSHDFEIAIEEGATMVRVGTAIFGERERN
jgi:pyridoxal phosphate enzyme (YggS family)